MDVITDATDNAHAAIFICGIDRDFRIEEELAGGIAHRGTTRGTDLQ